MRIIAAFSVFFLLLSSSSRPAAGEVEYDVSASAPPNSAPVFDAPVSVLADYHLYTSTGDVLAAWSALHSLEIRGGTLTIGSAGNPTLPGKAGAGLSLDMPDANLIFNDYLDVINVVSSQGAGGTSTGTSLAFDTLSMMFGGWLIVGDGEADAGGRNRVEFRELALGAVGAAGGIALGKNSALSITGDGGTVISGFCVADLAITQFEVELSEGSTLSVAGGLTLRHARVVGDGRIAADVTLDSRFTDVLGNTGATAEIVVAGGRKQEYGGDVIIGSNGGVVSVTGDASGGAIMRIDGALAVDGGFSGSGVAVKGVGGNSGRLDAGDLRLIGGGRVEVGEYGVLTVGEAGASGGTELREGGVDIGGNGEAVFNTFLSLSGTAGIIAHDGGLATFAKNPEMSGDANIRLLRGGMADFSGIAGGAELTGGHLFASGGGNAAAAGEYGLIAGAADVIRVDGPGSSLSLYRTLAGASSGVADGRLAVASAEALALSDGGELRVGEFVVSGGVGDADNPAAIFSSASGLTPNGVVVAETFVVERDAHASGDAGVAIAVNGDARIAGSYRAAGTGNDFLSGLLVEGALAAAGDALVNLGAGGLRLDGGFLDGTDGTLGLSGSALPAVGAITVSGRGNRVAGRVDASGFSLNVDGDLELSPASELAVDSYRQTSGSVTNAAGGSGAGIWVRNGGRAAAIDGAGAVFSANAIFDGGASFSNGAVLAGSGNVVAASLPGTGSIHVDATSRLELAGGGLTIRNLKSVEVDGVFSLGFNPDAAENKANALTLEGGVVVVFGEGAKIELDDSFLAGYFRNGDFAADAGADPSSLDWIIRGRAAPPGNLEGGWTVSNIFGDFTFGHSENGIWIDAFRANPDLDPPSVTQRLRDAWGGGLIVDSFAANVAAVARNRAESFENGGAPGTTGAYAKPGSFSGGLLYRMLFALASDQSTFSFADGSGRSVSGVVDRGLVSALNGRNAHGPFLVSRGVALDAMSGILDRLANDRLPWPGPCPGNASGRTDAGVVMDGRGPREFWASAIGVRQNAGSRGGVDGYSYGGSGLQIGFDRARGLSRFGAAFARVEGDYRDRSAVAHASVIDNYTFSLYASQKHHDGCFAVAVVGYTDTRNRIREFRGGNWDKAEYDIGTPHGMAGIGYEYRHDGRLTISPFLGFAYLKSRAGGHDWHYADVALMRYGVATGHAVRVPLEVAATYDLDLGGFGGLALDAKLGYARNLGQGKVKGAAEPLGLIGAVPVEVAGRDSGRDEVSFGSGLVYRRDEWELGLRYHYRYSGGYGAHRFSGTVGIGF